MWGLPKGRKQLAANIDAASAEVDTNAGEENEEIKPIGKGVFGNIYDQFKGKAKSAINFLMKIKSGEADRQRRGGHQCPSSKKLST